VEFADAGAGLRTLSAGSAMAFELCGPAKGACRFADARLDGNKVKIEARPGETPVRVRYCWGEAPRCNLYDLSGLPAGPFEVAIQ
jgi:sialate O-acetylesterase